MLSLKITLLVMVKHTSLGLADDAASVLLRASLVHVDLCAQLANLGQVGSKLGQYLSTPVELEVRQLLHAQGCHKVMQRMVAPIHLHRQIIISRERPPSSAERQKRTGTRQHTSDKNRL